jgi:hypothetical protein
VAIRNLVIIGLHIVISAALAAVTAMAVHAVLNDALRTARAEMLQTYIRVRADREQAIFDRAADFIQSAEAAFRRRLDTIDAADVDAQFDALFPPHGDGTRRSAPALFDGQDLPGGDHVFGVGAFLGNGEAMTLDEKRRYLAGFHVVRTVGEAHLQRFSSLYYYTPDRRMVMFAPNRPDRLAFYRFDAPADFNLQADEDPRLFSRETNPAGEMQCTQLSRFVYRDQGERSATACRKPVRQGDTLLGAFGTSIMMTDHLAQALEAPPVGGLNLMFGRDRQVIARGRPDGAGGPDRVDPIRVMSYLADDPRPRGVVQATDLGQMIAFSRIDGPDWYFVSVVPLDDIERTAAGWARMLFLIVFAASLVFAALRGALRRRLPLRRLVRRQRAARAE